MNHHLYNDASVNWFSRRNERDDNLFIQLSQYQSLTRPHGGAIVIRKVCALSKKLAKNAVAGTGIQF